MLNVGDIVYYTQVTDTSAPPECSGNFAKIRSNHNGIYLLVFLNEALGSWWTVKQNVVKYRPLNRRIVNV